MIARLTQINPLREPSRLRRSLASTSGSTAVSKLDRLVLVDDAARLGEDRHYLDVSCENLAIAVEDIGPRRRDDVAAAALGAGVLLLVQAEIDQLAADDAHRARGKRRR